MDRIPNKAEKRHTEILNRLAVNGMVNLGELCGVLECSESTVRNDLSHLEERGELKRTLGGAVSLGMAHLGRSMSVRTELCKQEKHALAEYVVNNFLRSGSSVILDTGSTCIEIARSIIEAGINVSVITNNFLAAAVLTKANHVDLYLSGGKYNRGKCSFDDTEFLRTMRAEFFFFAVNGVTADTGYTIPHAEEVYIKRMMIDCASKTFAVVDSSKIGNVGLKVVCGFDRVKSLITDSNADPDQLVRLRDAGAEVMVVPLPRNDND